MQPTYRIALVYPPWGPLGVANLGLALLAAGLKARGFACNTFYWMFRILQDLPGATRAEKGAAYRLLSSGALWPLNEWAFTRSLHGEEIAGSELEARRLVADAVRQFRGLRFGLGETVLAMRERAPGWVRQMADELEPYDVVGVGSTFFQNIAALALLKEVKRRWPHKVTVLGGANCDAEMGGALLEQFPQLDYTFGGEVDHSFPTFVERLARGQDVEGLPGLFHRDAQGTVRGQAAPPLDDLGSLPLPDYDDFVLERQRFGMEQDGDLVLALESSRGCWWGAKSHCTFCGLNANGMAYRHKSAARFQAEVEEITRRYGARYLFMADNIMAMDYYGDFASWAKQRGLGVNFFYEIKANVTRKQVASLRDAGVTMAQPGIESFSSKVLTLMRKGVKGIQNVAFLKYARECGIVPVYNILAKFPGEEPEEYRRMADQLPKLVHLRPPSGVVAIEYHRFSPYHRAPEEFGIRLRPDRRYRQLYPFSEEVLARIAYRFERSDANESSPRPYLTLVEREVLRWLDEYREDTCLLSFRESDDELVISDRRPSFPKRDYRLRGFAVHVFGALDDPRTLEGAVREAERLAAGLAAHQEEPTDPQLVTLRLRGLGRVPTAPAAGETVPPWRAAPTAEGARGLGRLREEVIAFGREEFLADPKACLDWLTRLGLFYYDDNRYLALPVRQDRSAARVVDWARAKI